MHEASGFLVKSTWLREIKIGNFEFWTGLSYSNMSKYCPRAVGTMKGHIVQSSQGVKSTKKKKIPPLIVTGEILKDVQGEEELDDTQPPIKMNELYIWDKPISKFYTEDCGRFPIRSRIRNDYIMIL